MTPDELRNERRRKNPERLDHMPTGPIALNEEEPTTED